MIPRLPISSTFKAKLVASYSIRQKDLPRKLALLRIHLDVEGIQKWIRETFRDHEGPLSMETMMSQALCDLYFRRGRNSAPRDFLTLLAIQESSQKEALTFILNWLSSPIKTLSDLRTRKTYTFTGDTNISLSMHFDIAAHIFVPVLALHFDRRQKAPYKEAVAFCDSLLEKNGYPLYITIKLTDWMRIAQLLDHVSSRKLTARFYKQMESLNVGSRAWMEMRDALREWFNGYARNLKAVSVHVGYLMNPPNPLQSGLFSDLARNALRNILGHADISKLNQVKPLTWLVENESLYGDERLKHLAASLLHRRIRKEGASLLSFFNLFGETVKDEQENPYLLKVSVTRDPEMGIPGEAGVLLSAHASVGETRRGRRTETILFQDEVTRKFGYPMKGIVAYIATDDFYPQGKEGVVSITDVGLLPSLVNSSLLREMAKKLSSVVPENTRIDVSLVKDEKAREVLKEVFRERLDFPLNK